MFGVPLVVLAVWPTLLIAPVSLYYLWESLLTGDS